jgi:triacylglycerol lipase
MEVQLDDAGGDGLKDGIYYQSYATRMRFGAFFSLCPGDRLYLPTWLILKSMEGDNDGMVSVESAKFGKFRGVKAGAFFGPGVNHMAQINQLLGFVCFFNPRKWIAEIVTDLKSLGY